MKLARFRADPATVSVRIRREEPSGWTCQIISKVRSNLSVIVTDETPEAAVGTALFLADLRAFPGIDLEMQWAYTHPWKE